ncbi:MAG: Uma2 family endonuclease, partial [Gemmatimonadales bacterium]
PSTASRDRGIKRQLYQRAGVPEYWIVDLDSRLIERWRPRDERPEILRETLVWQAPGAGSAVEIRLAEFFGDLLDR